MQYLKWNATPLLVILQRHPDKGRCAEAFKALSEAHRVLADPEERAAYDAHEAEAAYLAHENFEQEEESDNDPSDDYAEASMASMQHDFIRRQ
jgi:DnaJ-class molecular chaperone